MIAAKRELIEHVADFINNLTPRDRSQPHVIHTNGRRHTFATGLESCDMKESVRVKLARHSDWRQTDRYTDPASLPLFAEMEKFAALLPSSIPSLLFWEIGSEVGQS